MIFPISFFVPTLRNLFRSFRSTVNCGRLSTRIPVTIGNGVKIAKLAGLEAEKNLQIGDYSKIMLNHENPELDHPKMIFGQSVKIGDRNQLVAGSGSNFRIGDYSSTHSGCHLFGNIQIGRFCLLSANIFASTGDHQFETNPYKNIKDQDTLFPTKITGNIVIEDDCWIGWGSVLKNNITIGRGSVIGANSVVTKDVPPYSVYGGTPAKLIRKRLDFNPGTQVSVQKIETLPYLYRGFKTGHGEIIEKVGRKFCKLSDTNYAVFKKDGSSKLMLILFSESDSSVNIKVGSKTTCVSLIKGLNEIILDTIRFEETNAEVILPLMSDYTILMIAGNSELYFESVSFI